MMGRHGHSRAEVLYQSGADRAEAVLAGVSGEFDQLEARYRGASIPAHIWGGFRYQAPYSSPYHTGRGKGELLRALCKALQGTQL